MRVKVQTGVHVERWVSDEAAESSYGQAVLEERSIAGLGSRRTVYGPTEHLESGAQAADFVDLAISRNKLRDNLRMDYPPQAFTDEELEFLRKFVAGGAAP